MYNYGLFSFLESNPENDYLLKEIPYSALIAWLLSTQGHFA